MNRNAYYRGTAGKKYGIWNDIKKEFQTRHPEGEIMNIDVDNGTTESIRDKCMRPSKYHIEDRFGKILCGWDHKNEGYPVSTLRAMQDAGYLYCINGKPQERL